ncbi:MAG: hypothetical protein HY591_04350, partial [Candidatus Omnitrophica bacterium]|nr:hypothetical protein [Candidatus Omnitrophota bacterium]
MGIPSTEFYTITNNFYGRKIRTENADGTSSITKEGDWIEGTGMARKTFVYAPNGRHIETNELALFKALPYEGDGNHFDELRVSRHTPFDQDYLITRKYIAPGTDIVMAKISGRDLTYFDPEQAFESPFATRYADGHGGVAVTLRSPHGQHVTKQFVHTIHEGKPSKDGDGVTVQSLDMRYDRDTRLITKQSFDFRGVPLKSKSFTAHYPDLGQYDSHELLSLAKDTTKQTLLETIDYTYEPTLLAETAPGVFEPAVGSPGTVGINESGTNPKYPFREMAASVTIKNAQGPLDTSKQKLQTVQKNNPDWPSSLPQEWRVYGQSRTFNTGRNGFTSQLWINPQGQAEVVTDAGFHRPGTKESPQSPKPQRTRMSYRLPSLKTFMEHMEHNDLKSVALTEPQIELKVQPNLSKASFVAFYARGIDVAKLEIKDGTGKTVIVNGHEVNYKEGKIRFFDPRLRKETVGAVKDPEHTITVVPDLDDVINRRLFIVSVSELERAELDISKITRAVAHVKVIPGQSVHQISEKMIVLGDNVQKRGEFDISASSRTYVINPGENGALVTSIGQNAREEKSNKMSIRDGISNKGRIFVTDIEDKKTRLVTYNIDLGGAGALFTITLVIDTSDPQKPRPLYGLSPYHNEINANYRIMSVDVIGDKVKVVSNPARFLAVEAQVFDPNNSSLEIVDSTDYGIKYIVRVQKMNSALTDRALSNIFTPLVELIKGGKGTTIAEAEFKQADIDFSAILNLLTGKEYIKKANLAYLYLTNDYYVDPKFEMLDQEFKNEAKKLGYTDIQLKKVEAILQSHKANGYTPMSAQEIADIIARSVKPDDAFITRYLQYGTDTADSFKSVNPDMADTFLRGRGATGLVPHHVGNPFVDTVMEAKLGLEYIKLGRPDVAEAMLNFYRGRFYAGDQNHPRIWSIYHKDSREPYWDSLSDSRNPYSKPTAYGMIAVARLAMAVNKHYKERGFAPDPRHVQFALQIMKSLDEDYRMQAGDQSLDGRAITRAAFEEHGFDYDKIVPKLVTEGYLMGQPGHYFVNPEFKGFGVSLNVFNTWFDGKQYTQAQFKDIQTILWRFKGVSSSERILYGGGISHLPVLPVRDLVGEVKQWENPPLYNVRTQSDALEVFKALGDDKTGDVKDPKYVNDRIKQLEAWFAEFTRMYVYKPVTSYRFELSGLNEFDVIAGKLADKTSGLLLFNPSAKEYRVNPNFAGNMEAELNRLFPHYSNEQRRKIAAILQDSVNFMVPRGLFEVQEVNTNTFALAPQLWTSAEDTLAYIRAMHDAGNLTTQKQALLKTWLDNLAKARGAKVNGFGGIDYSIPLSRNAAISADLTRQFMDTAEKIGHDQAARWAKANLAKWQDDQGRVEIVRSESDTVLTYRNQGEGSLRRPDGTFGIDAVTTLGLMQHEDKTGSTIPTPISEDIKQKMNEFGKSTWLGGMLLFLGISNSWEVRMGLAAWTIVSATIFLVFVVGIIAYFMRKRRALREAKDHRRFAHREFSLEAEKRRVRDTHMVNHRGPITSSDGPMSVNFYANMKLLYQLMFEWRQDITGLSKGDLEYKQDDERLNGLAEFNIIVGLISNKLMFINVYKDSELTEDSNHFKGRFEERLGEIISGFTVLMKARKHAGTVTASSFGLQGSSIMRALVEQGFVTDKGVLVEWDFENKGFNKAAFDEIVTELKKQKLMDNNFKVTSGFVGLNRAFKAAFPTYKPEQFTAIEEILQETPDYRVNPRFTAWPAQFNAIEGILKKAVAEVQSIDRNIDAFLENNGLHKRAEPVSILNRAGLWSDHLIVPQGYAFGFLEKFAFENAKLDFNVIVPALIAKGFVFKGNRVATGFTGFGVTVDVFNTWFKGATFTEAQMRQIEGILKKAEFLTAWEIWDDLGIAKDNVLDVWNGYKGFKRRQGWYLLPIARWAIQNGRYMLYGGLGIGLAVANFHAVMGEGPAIEFMLRMMLKIFSAPFITGFSMPFWWVALPLALVAIAAWYLGQRARYQYEPALDRIEKKDNHGKAFEVTSIIARILLYGLLSVLVWIYPVAPLGGWLVKFFTTLWFLMEIAGISVPFIAGSISQWVQDYANRKPSNNYPDGKGVGKIKNGWRYFVEFVNSLDFGASRPVSLTGLALRYHYQPSSPSGTVMGQIMAIITYHAHWLVFTYLLVYIGQSALNSFFMSAYLAGLGWQLIAAAGIFAIQMYLLHFALSVLFTAVANGIGTFPFKVLLALYAVASYLNWLPSAWFISSFVALGVLWLLANFEEEILQFFGRVQAMLERARYKDKGGITLIELNGGDGYRSVALGVGVDRAVDDTLDNWRRLWQSGDRGVRIFNAFFGLNYKPDNNAQLRDLLRLLYKYEVEHAPKPLTLWHPVQLVVGDVSGGLRGIPPELLFSVDNDAEREQLEQALMVRNYLFALSSFGGQSQNVGSNLIDMILAIKDDGQIDLRNIRVNLISNHYANTNGGRPSNVITDAVLGDEKHELAQRTKLVELVSSLAPEVKTEVVYDWTPVGAKSANSTAKDFNSETSTQISSRLMIDRNAAVGDLKLFLRDLKRIRSDERVVIVIPGRTTTNTQYYVGRASELIEGGHRQFTKGIMMIGGTAGESIGTGWGNIQSTSLWRTLAKMEDGRQALYPYSDYVVSTQGYWKSYWAKLFGLRPFNTDAEGISEDIWGVEQEARMKIGLAIGPRFAASRAKWSKVRERSFHSSWLTAYVRWAGGFMQKLSDKTMQELAELGPMNLYAKEIRGNSGQFFYSARIALLSILTYPLAIIGGFSPFVGIYFLLWQASLVFNQVLTLNGLIHHLEAKGFYRKTASAAAAVYVLISLMGLTAFTPAWFVLIYLVVGFLHGLGTWLFTRGIDGLLFAKQLLVHSLGQFKRQTLIFNVSGEHPDNLKNKDFRDFDRRNVGDRTSYKKNGMFSFFIINRVLGTYLFMSYLGAIAWSLDFLNVTMLFPFIIYTLGAMLGAYLMGMSRGKATLLEIPARMFGWVSAVAVMVIARHMLGSSIGIISYLSWPALFLPAIMALVWQYTTKAPISKGVSFDDSWLRKDEWAAKKLRISSGYFRSFILGYFAMLFVYLVPMPSVLVIDTIGAYRTVIPLDLLIDYGTKAFAFVLILKGLGMIVVRAMEHVMVHGIYSRHNAKNMPLKDIVKDFVEHAHAGDDWAKFSYIASHIDQLMIFLQQTNLGWSQEIIDEIRNIKNSKTHPVVDKTAKVILKIMEAVKPVKDRVTFGINKALDSAANHAVARAEEQYRNSVKQTIEKAVNTANVQGLLQSLLSTILPAATAPPRVTVTQRHNLIDMAIENTTVPAAQQSAVRNYILDAVRNKRLNITLVTRDGRSIPVAAHQINVRFASVHLEIKTVEPVQIRRVVVTLADDNQNIATASMEVNNTETVRTFERAGDRTAVAGLMELLKTDEWTVRRNARQALDNLGVNDEQKRQANEEALKSPNSFARQEAVWALAGIITKSDFETAFLKGGEIFDWLIKNDYLEKISNIEGRFKVKADDIKDILERQYPEYSGRISDLLRQSRPLGSQDTMAKLVELLKDDNKYVRASAREALKHLGASYETRHQGYMAALASADGDVRKDAGKGLEELADEYQKTLDSNFREIDRRASVILQSDDNIASQIAKDVRDEKSIFTNIAMDADVSATEAVLSLQKIITSIIGDSPDSGVDLMPIEQIHSTLVTQTVGVELSLNVDDVIDEVRVDADDFNVYEYEIAAAHLMPNFAIVIELRSMTPQVMLFRERSRKRMDARTLKEGERAFVQNINHISVAYITKATPEQLRELNQALKAWKPRAGAKMIKAQRVRVSLNVNKRITESAEFFLGMPPLTGPAHPITSRVLYIYAGKIQSSNPTAAEQLRQHADWIQAREFELLAANPQGPPEAHMVAYYDEAIDRIAFNIPQDQTPPDTLAFIQEHEGLHQERVKGGQANLDKDQEEEIILGIQVSRAQTRNAVSPDWTQDAPFAQRNTTTFPISVMEDVIDIVKEGLAKTGAGAAEDFAGNILAVGASDNADHLIVLMARFPGARIIGVEWDADKADALRQGLDQRAEGLDYILSFLKAVPDGRMMSAQFAPEMIER